MAENWLDGRILQRVAVLGAVLALSAPLSHTADAARPVQQGQKVRVLTPTSASHSIVARSHARVMASSVHGNHLS